MKVNTKLISMIEKLRAELVALLNVDRTDLHREEIERLEQKEKNVMKSIEDNPIWKGIMSKAMGSDYGVNYTEEEQAFMDSNNSIAQSRKITEKIWGLENDEKKAFVKRIVGGKATEEDMVLINGAEFSIWNTQEDFLGEKASYDLPMFTLDSTYLEIFEYGEWGGTYTTYVTPFEDKLREMGYYLERYNWGVYMIVPLN